MFVAVVDDVLLRQQTEIDSTRLLRRVNERWIHRDADRLLVNDADVAHPTGTGAKRRLKVRVVLGPTKDPLPIELDRLRIQWLAVMEGDAFLDPPDEAGQILGKLPVAEPAFRLDHATAVVGRQRREVQVVARALTAAAAGGGDVECRRERSVADDDLGVEVDF